MLKNLARGDVQTTLAIIAFAVTAIVFAVGIWRAVRIKPEEKEHLSHLPLDDGENGTHKS